MRRKRKKEPRFSCKLSVDGRMQIDNFASVLCDKRGQTPIEGMKIVIQ